jgi:hypothetical protein
MKTRTVTCAICGKEFETSHWRKSICSPECKATRNARYDSAYKKVYHKENYIPRQRVARQVRQEHAYTIIHDPLGEDGGFPKGNRFPESEIKLMAAMQTLTRGTLLRDPKGRTLKYNGRKLEAI